MEAILFFSFEINFISTNFIFLLLRFEIKMAPRKMSECQKLDNHVTGAAVVAQRLERQPTSLKTERLWVRFSTVARLFFFLSSQ